VLLAAALMIASPSPELAGLYQSQQIEVGAALELGKDGRYRYQLDYGAISENGEGDWSFDGTAVTLTSRPKPKLPSFELVRDDPAPKGDIVISIEPPGFGQDFRIDAIAIDAVSGERGLVTTGSDGHVEAGGHLLAAVEPLVPVYGTVAGHFILSQDRGHHLLLRFHANDLGRADFDGERLQATTDGLILRRFETEIRFVRVRP
jgi:hypothetical protein